MRVLAAPDKFRGTASAEEVCAAIAAAVLAAGGSCVSRPMADGGEGMLEAFGGGNRQDRVTGPDGEPVAAAWRMTDDGLAVIECAQACGLTLAGGAERNDPIAATTRGVGELISHALDAGARRILVGMGGTASTDGGYGAVQVLAGRLAGGPPVPIAACCDVRTTFLQAASVFGPQKGADPAQVSWLAERLRGYREEYRARFGVDVESIAGSGAAGGLAGGLAALGAELVPGFDAIADEVGFDALLADADWVVTGEGKFDATSQAGKVVGGVLERARAAGVPALIVAGVVDDEVTVERVGDVAVISLTERFGADRAWQQTVACITEAVVEAVGALGGTGPARG
jgi:glycerate kinase